MDAHMLTFAASCTLLYWLVATTADELQGNWDRIVSALKGVGA